MTWVRRLALPLAAILFGTFAPSLARAAPSASDALTVTIRPMDIYPPAPVTNLRGSPGAEGQMLLEWSAPDSNNNQFLNRTPATSYTIRIATFSSDSVGSTTTWWNNANDVTGEPAPSQPGSNEVLLLTGLTPAVTYWASIISVDDVGLVSLIDTNTTTPGQQANALVFQSQKPPIPGNFAGVAQSSVSIQWTWDITPLATFYRLIEPPSTQIVETASTNFTETGLTPNVSVTRFLIAGNASALSDPTTAQTVFTLATVPTNLTIGSVGATSIDLTWNANANPAGTLYRLERSLDGTNFANLVTTTSVAHQDTGLTAQTSYYYRVSALNGDLIAAGPTAIVSTTTLSTIDGTPPDQPLGLRGFLDPTGAAFTLIWEAVNQNADQSALSDLAGYHIYRRSTLFGTATRLTPTPVTSTVFADRVDGQTYFYTIRAVDLNGNESVESMFADSSPLSNVIYLATDQVSTVVMPSSVNDLLRSAHNPTGVPLAIELEEQAVVPNTEVVRHVRLKLIRGDNKEEVSGVAFAIPDATVAVGYNLVNGQIQQGAPNTSSVLESLASTLNVSPSQLSLYWHNGATWVKVGGSVSLTGQTVGIKTSFLGDYQIRSIAGASVLNLEKANVFPRLFTPNGDGFNDVVYFVLENPNDVQVSGKILDINGRFVANLTPPVNNSGIGTTLIWDGKDAAGVVVPSGAYFYKIEGEGQTFTGTVGVAR